MEQARRYIRNDIHPRPDPELEEQLINAITQTEDDTAFIELLRHSSDSQAYLQGLYQDLVPLLVPERAYDQDLTKYQCSANGTCERSLQGYDTLEECQQHCTATANKDLAYIMYAYDPAQALELPPHDQVRVVKELLGIQVSSYHANYILHVLVDDNWVELRETLELQDYLRQRYDPVEILARDFYYAQDFSEELPVDFERLSLIFQQIVREYQPQLQRLHQRVMSGQVEITHDPDYLAVTNRLARVFLPEYRADHSPDLYYDQVMEALPFLVAPPVEN